MVASPFKYVYIVVDQQSNHHACIDAKKKRPSLCRCAAKERKGLLRSIMHAQHLDSSSLYRYPRHPSLDRMLLSQQCFKQRTANEQAASAANAKFSHLAEFMSQFHQIFRYVRFAEDSISDNCICFSQTRIWRSLFIRVEQLDGRQVGRVLRSKSGTEAERSSLARCPIRNGYRHPWKSAFGSEALLPPTYSICLQCCSVSGNLKRCQPTDVFKLEFKLPTSPLVYTKGKQEKPGLWILLTLVDRLARELSHLCLVLLIIFKIPWDWMGDWYRGKVHAGIVKLFESSGGEGLGLVDAVQLDLMARLCLLEEADQQAASCSHCFPLRTTCRSHFHVERIFVGWVLQDESQARTSTSTHPSASRGMLAFHNRQV